ncbi:MAG: GNAT family N-acetyltransferase [Shewanella sp.]|nr:GNAT family N-acetyltransferase [Shewanella sp.]MCF1432099.1 GNAT family N-acetyltransferase [Shewanella sp.]MCF1439067.1 GNAT family N-acetyltransferase [Shewanella sp.]MCF1458369.1 GNAT family N-acetyltransferase [Shewanella sp.]
MVQIQLAQQQDLQELLRLERLHVSDELGGQHSMMQGESFSEAALKRLIDAKQVLIAQQQGQIAGYVLSGAWQEYIHWPLQRRALTQLKSYWSDVERSCCHYGPVWVSPAFRGQKICRKLCQALATHLNGRFSHLIGLIAEDNEASLRAHVGDDGMQLVDFIEYDDKGYYLVSRSIGC